MEALIIGFKCTHRSSWRPTRVQIVTSHHALYVYYLIAFKNDLETYRVCISMGSDIKSLLVQHAALIAKEAHVSSSKLQPVERREQVPTGRIQGR